MGVVRLGKLLLRWCDQCNLPVLEVDRCGRCQETTRPVEVTPPGDVRPAFPFDVQLIRRVLDNQFGSGAGEIVLPDGKIVLLSKVPGIDRMEEVIADGKVLGTLRYDIGKGWTMVMRVPAARSLQGSIRKGFIIADDGAIKPILSSNNLMAPGVVQTAPGVRKGDEVIVVDRQLRAFATGTAKMNDEEMLQNGKGVAVKVRWTEPPGDQVPRSDMYGWDDVLEANRDILAKRVGEAVEFIHDVHQRHSLPTIVSFSGGKDSLACLLLSLDAGYHFPALFVDTGLEFPETVDYVHRTAKYYHLDLIVEKAPENAFFGNLDYFGPPGRDFRWCCKTNKLGPTVRAIMGRYPNGVLSLIGQRRYESEQRADKPRVWHNPWTPGQVGASPIQNWTALHVWLYIFSKRAPYNPWYEKGLDRIGCFLCPASDLAEFELIMDQSEELSRWKQFLEDFAEVHGLPEQWVRLGLWRWKRLPISIKEELTRAGISPELLKRKEMQQTSGKEARLALHMQEGFSPCIMGYSIEGAFNRYLDLERVANVLNMVGPVELNSTEGYCSLPGFTLFQEGALIAKGKDQGKIKEKIETVRRVVVKAEECVGCGVCVARCKEGALMLDRDKVAIMTERCTHCGGCIEPCPAINFSDTTFDF